MKGLMHMMLYPRIAVALGAAALLTGGATATAAPSSHHQRHHPDIGHTQTQSDLGDIGNLVSTAIAKDVRSGKVNAVEADLARVFLDGAITPDVKLRDAWKSIVRATASYLGVTTAALQKDLAEGNSLASIARKHDHSPEALIQAVVAASKVQLDEAVADGSLSPAARADILDLMRRNLGAVLRARL